MTENKHTYYGDGVILTAGFDLHAAAPLDYRTLFTDWTSTSLSEVPADVLFVGLLASDETDKKVKILKTKPANASTAADCTWEEVGKVLSEGNGISISNDTVSVKYDNSTIKVDGSGNLYVNGDTSEYTEGNNIDITNHLVSALGYTYDATKNSFAEGNSTASGTSSHSEGYATTASGPAAHSEGTLTTASGGPSHAEGYHTTASGHYGAHAEGDYAVASNSGAHAEGQSTTASGIASHAEGARSLATGEGAHAEGYTITSASKQASGQGSHVEGNCLYGTMLADGIGAHIEGHVTTGTMYAEGPGAHTEGSGHNGTMLAYGEGSHAEGWNTKVFGVGAHAEGRDSLAFGALSHSEGNAYTAVYVSGISGAANTTTYTTSDDHNLKVGDLLFYLNNTENNKIFNCAKIIDVPSTTSFVVDHSLSLLAITSGSVNLVTGAYGNSSHTEGKCTKALNEAEHAEGMYNISHTDTIHSTGIGVGESARKNAFEIMQNGDTYLYGVGNYNGTTIKASGNNIQTLQDVLGTIPAALINADWNASSGVAEILNKPTIPTVNDATYSIKTDVSGTETTVSDFTANQSIADSITFVQGSNVILTPDATNGKITIAATDTTYSDFAGSTHGLVPGASSGDAGKFLKADGSWDTPASGGTVTSVAAGNGLKTADGNAITSSGTILLDEDVNTTAIASPENFSGKKYNGVFSVDTSQTIAVTGNANPKFREVIYLIYNEDDTSSITVAISPSSGVSAINMSGSGTGITIPAEKYCEIILTCWSSTLITYNFGISA